MNTDVRTIERGEGRGVGSGVDRGCVDIVDVDQIPTRNAQHKQGQEVNQNTTNTITIQLNPSTTT